MIDVKQFSHRDTESQRKNRGFLRVSVTYHPLVGLRQNV